MTERYGSHSVVFGFDSFNDHRLANNYQSNTNFRVLGTSAMIRGTNVYQHLGDGSTLIQWDPLQHPQQRHRPPHQLRIRQRQLALEWRGRHLNVGLRFDKNDAVDAADGPISNSSRWTPGWASPGTRPRTDDGPSGSFARYASSLSTGVAENSPAGNPATYQFRYTGPSVNADANAALVTPDAAIQTVFGWLTATVGPAARFRRRPFRA